ncbi:MAG: zinc ribbon domain-containing protein [Candidatus Krumholzibacteriota bacterium]|nr:zinc ribbon domain-containing protein [Candidatus Krumholzibacteriota bacterium]
MFCRHCGREIEEAVEYCPGCGKKQRENGETFSRKLYHTWEVTRLKPVDEQKSPGVAAAIGFFLGWIFLGPVGYIYLGQWNWFWLTFAIQIFAIPLSVGFAYPLLPIVLAIHQYQMAKDLNGMLPPLPPNGYADVDEPEVDRTFEEL